ncbi:MAG: hypothetical protein K8F91_22640 [Candidatus Obscuribacterales bacterium]|nr:hypothetical protein [Candidatus Obscuribacterales bacterium]
MNEVNSIFHNHLDNWAQGSNDGEQALEASAPHFCEKLGIDPIDFTFRSYAQPGDPSEWTQVPIEFPEMLEGTMYLYLPSRWTGSLKQKNLAQVQEGQRVRQTLIIASKEDWRATLSEFQKVGEVNAFAYYPIQPPYYDQWIACIEEQDKIWIYSFYGAGDWVLISKGDAGGRNTLGLQITSSVHSSPWYSWIASSQE